MIELAFVIAIILVLAAIAIPVYLGQQKQAQVSTLQADVTSTITNVSSWVRSQGTMGANPTNSQFLAMKVSSSPQNSITLSKYNMTNPATAELCVQGDRLIDGTAYRFHASTRNGTLAEGPCTASPVLPAEQVG